MGTCGSKFGDCLPSPPEPSAYAPNEKLDFYVSVDSIFKQLRPVPGLAVSPVKLLDSVWLLARADRIAAAKTQSDRRALALPHRQALEAQHPEAYLTADQVANLQRNGETGALAVGGISHAWLQVDHPDPLGEQLLRLADLLRRAQRGELPRQQQGWSDDRVFRITPYPCLPGQVALFYDFCSIHQSVKDESGVVLVERSPHEQAAFQHALQEMQLWYAHQKLFAVLLSKLPAGAIAPPYESRGWTTTERAWTMVAKANSNQCWPMILDVGEEGGEATRVPPMHPHDFEAHLESKRFTSDKVDRPLVTRLYRTTVESVLGGSETLRYGFSAWQPADFVKLGRVLPLCTQLRVLRLSNNAGGDTMVVSVLSAAHNQGALRLVEELDIHNNGVTDDGMAALTEALADVTLLPRLRKLGVVGNTASEGTLDILGSVCAKRKVELDRSRRKAALRFDATFGSKKLQEGVARDRPELKEVVEGDSRRSAA